ncbi:glycosyltransferase [Butyrivibrio sp. XB500-5]|uniref:glycosyltransferase n=1 Tax=Butyrivibrio sp. XB500-5 TaxID=2364880 RepID=UPI001FAA475C|nr:glycosyltransferase [Butyrivibrio sp. XB500-5]
MKDKVLVLMATYNGEKYLREQLDSILRQIGVQVRILVRDDGSTDKTIEILEEYAQKSDLEWYTGEHLNVSRGNLDLMKKASKTDYLYFAFADQDDVWDDDKLSAGINEIREFTCPALYYCGQRLVDADLNLIGDHRLNAERDLKTRFILSDFAGCTGVFNRKLLEKTVIYDPGYILMHDTWILKICLAVGGKVIVDPEMHMDYRQHGGNSIGLNRSLLAYLKQVYQYLFVYDVESQMIELAKGYSEEMVSPYKELCDWVCGYRKDRKKKALLLDKKNVDFCAKGLNLTYAIKVHFNKL